jgi:hypothetical protein
MNTWRDACESQQDELTWYWKITEAKAVSTISLMTDFFLKKSIEQYVNVFAIVGLIW